MGSRPSILKPSLLVAICAGLVAYGLCAEAFDFHLVGLRGPTTSVIDHRLWECILLWPVACSGIGWIQYLRKQRPQRTAAMWPMLVVPLAMAVWLTISEARNQYANYCERAASAQPATSFWLIDVGIPVLGIALPLALGVSVSLLLIVQAIEWRQPVTPGVCPTCSYNLTGNVSGVCPECGAVIVEDQAVPRSFYAQNHRWLPELSFFPDAKTRYDAFQHVWRGHQRSPICWLGVLSSLSMVVSSLPSVAARLDTFWVPVLATSSVVFLAALWVSYRAIRRALRQQLRAHNRCEWCGRELITERCPGCEENQ